MASRSPGWNRSAMPITSADPATLSRRGFLIGLTWAASFALTAPAMARESPMRMTCRFAGQAFTVRLNDSPAARDLFALLPLDLRIEDYAHNEKIAYLPRKLTEEGAGPFGDEAAGDVCTYAPWGNLVFFHAPYRYSRGLIRLGRIEGGIAPLLLRGTYPLGLTRIG